MSRHICFRCACGEADFGASARFTYLVWEDGTGGLAAAGLGVPSRRASDGDVVDGGDFLRWWEPWTQGVREARDWLPVLYEVWRKGPGGFDHSAAGYFAWRGRVYMAQAAYDSLPAVPLSPETWEERRRDAGYEPPVVDDADAELSAALEQVSEDGEIRLTADAFERIFRGVPLSLEHGHLPDFFADELREADEMVRHAAARGEALTFYTY